MSTREPDLRARAVRVVAGCADDADDLRELLAMLGLDPTDALPPSERPTPAVPAQRHKRRGMPIAELATLLETALASRCA